MGSIRVEAPIGLRVHQQEILAELGARALDFTEPGALLQDAARLVALGLQTPFCIVLEYEAGAGGFVVRGGVGCQAGTIGARFDADPDLGSQPGDEGSLPLSPLLLDHDMRRGAAVAIRSAGAAFGVLEAGSPTPGEFGPADVAFMQAAANLLGIALERQRSEAALVLSRERNVRVLEHIGEVFIALDPDWRLTYVNRRAEEWWGRSRADLLGRNIWEEYPQVVGSEAYHAYQRAMRERCEMHLETISTLKHRWIEIRVYPAEDELAIYFHDIDDRKRAEMALRESEERLRLATESAGIGTWELDPATGRVMRSAQHAAIFGVDPREPWSLQSFLARVVPEDRPAVELLGQQAVARGSDWRFECRILRANDGALRWVELMGTPVREPGGEIRRFLGIITDVTARREAQATRDRLAELLEHRVAERTRELAEANGKLRAEMAERVRAEAALMQSQRLEAIGQLVGGVAHVFNNLLAAVIGNLELLHSVAEGPQIRRHLDRALRVAWRGATLTQQLLAYARKQHIEPQPVDVAAALAATDEPLRHMMGEGVQVDVEVERGLWWALGDAAQLRSVLTSLAANATDAMPQGGRLRVVAANVEAGSAYLPKELAPGDYVLLSVADTGCGMPEEVLARACEPFFTTKNVGQGHGLGLAQVDGIARQFDGAVRLHSTVGAGTTVEVFLRRAATAA